MLGKLATLVIILLLVQVTMVIWVNNEANEGRSALVDSQRDGCERSKLDRKATSNFQNTHSEYIRKVTGAASVKEDVKEAAREALKVYRKTSASLNSRANINCKEAFP
jgi:hypothetical protein